MFLLCVEAITGVCFYALVIMVCVCFCGGWEGVRVDIIVYKFIYVCLNMSMYVCIYMDGWMDIYGWMDGWMSTCTITLLCLH